MKYICIMGRNNSGKTSVVNKLEQLGFKVNKQYTTGKDLNTQEYVYKAEEDFDILLNKGILLEYNIYGNNYYGTAVPFGDTRYVGVSTLNGYKKLKENYGKQVIGVYLKCDKHVAKLRGTSSEDDNEVILKEMEQLSDTVIDSNKDLNSVLADILKLVR